MELIIATRSSLQKLALFIAQYPNNGLSRLKSLITLTSLLTLPLNLYQALLLGLQSGA